MELMRHFERSREILSQFVPIIMTLTLLFLFGCSNMPERYVYGGKILGRAVLIGERSENYSGIQVNLSSTAITGTITTLVDGRFVFTDLPDGTYEVICSKNPYASANVANIIVNKSSETDIGNLLLTPASPPGEPDATH